MSVKAIDLNVILSFLVSFGALGCSASTPTQTSENLPPDCPTYVLTSTDDPTQVYLSADKGTAPLFKPYKLKNVETYASTQGEDCNHISRHFSAMENFGKQFGGIILSGKPYTYVLQESEYPLDLTMDQANARGAFYDSFEDAVTFHLPAGASLYPVTEDRNNFQYKQMDYVRHCTELGILFSVWSDFKVNPDLDMKDPDIRTIRDVIYNLIRCEGEWNQSVKSKSSQPGQREAVRELYIDGLRTYYTRSDKERLLADREWFPTPGDCPSALQLFSEEGMCLEYLPPKQKTEE